MYFSTIFSALYIVLVVALTANHVSARPSAIQRSAGIKLPMRRIPDPEGIHPEMLSLRRHFAMQKRYARLTGNEGPSEAHIATGLKRRASEIQRRLNGSEFGHPPPSTPTALNSVGLSETDGGYAALVAIGSSGTNYRIVIDTGSADFWVAGKGCTSTEGEACINKIAFDPSLSSSFQNLGTPWSIQYGTGSASGTMVSDSVTLAGFGLPNVQFGLGTSLDPSNAPASFDGIMGFADSSSNSQHVPTPFQLLKQEGLITNAIFGVRMERPSDAENHSELTIGAADPTQFDASTLVTVSRVAGNTAWVAPMDTVVVNGVTLGLAGRTAILDTGTTGIGVPEDDLQRILGQIPGAQLMSDRTVAIPCNANLSFSITFGGRSFPIQTQDIIANFPNGEGCRSALNAVSAGLVGSSWLVGDTFLRNVYTIYDFDHSTIGIAQLSN